MRELQFNTTPYGIGRVDFRVKGAVFYFNTVPYGVGGVEFREKGAVQ